MMSATEKVIALRYMLRSLGVHVDYPTPIIGDNAPVITSATVHANILKKKHVAISCHKTREAAASGITHPVKIDSDNNLADVLTKVQSPKFFARQIGSIMY